MAKFIRTKLKSTGAAVYKMKGSTIPLNTGKDMFEGEPPAEIEIPDAAVPNLHKPWKLDSEEKKEAAKAKKLADAAEKEAVKAAKKADAEAKKLAAKAEKEAKAAAAKAEREVKAAEAKKEAEAKKQLAEAAKATAAKAEAKSGEGAKAGATA
jgi:hypothetical protein